ncbi:MAG: hypothetical protein CVU11_16260 [Bacteroidetes bacterium HGW-Bacteroidetes-6]|nr:MAG: hypothetical protein CVU11_16260 [Bacteroidetes bacterium HGW-Bacteroidetes-6]
MALDELDIFFFGLGMIANMKTSNQNKFKNEKHENQNDAFCRDNTFCLCWSRTIYFQCEFVLVV